MGPSIRSVLPRRIGPRRGSSALTVWSPWRMSSRPFFAIATATSRTFGIKGRQSSGASARAASDGQMVAGGCLFLSRPAITSPICLSVTGMVLIGTGSAPTLSGRDLLSPDWFI